MTVPSLHPWKRLPLLVVAGIAVLVACGMDAVAADAGRTSGLAQTQDAPRLIALLRAPESSVAEKARACQQLAVIGQMDAIPTLAALLDHPEISSYARDALEQMPFDEAGDALRRGLSEVSGMRLAGVVNSLGVRGEAKSVRHLIPLVKDPSRGVAAEALLALGRIGSDDALKVIRETLKTGGPALRSPAAEACLVAAEKALAKGEKEQAVSFYDAVRSAEVEEPLRLAAARGTILARGEQGVSLLVEALNSEDEALRQVALRAARELSGAAVSTALARELDGANPSTQVRLLEILRDRSEGDVHQAIEKLARADSAEVRLAALRALVNSREASSVRLLLDTVSRPGSPSEADAALESLSRIRAANTEAALVEALSSAPAPARARLIGVIGQRQASGATEALLRQAKDPDPAVSRAAFEALPMVASRGDLPDVIKAAIASRDPQAKQAAERAVYTIALKIPEPERRSDALAAAFKEVADPEGQVSIMQVLAMLGDAKAQEVIASGYASSDPQVRDTALRLLTHWGDAGPTPLLLGIFKSTTNDVHRTLALRGIVTLATSGSADEGGSGSASARPSEQSIKWLKEAAASVRDVPDEKRILLSGLGDLSNAEGLRLLEPYLDDTSVRREAALAAIRAAKGVSAPEDRDPARRLLEKVAAVNTDPDIRKQAEEALKSLSTK